MDEKVLVEVFGNKDETPSCGCSCSCCGPAKTMGESYDELVDYLKEMDVSSKVDIHFIDMNKDDVSKYGGIKEILDKGFTLPLTAINGTVKFYGGISNGMIYDGIKEELDK